MAGSLNKVTLLGNLGKDPEIRTLNSGDRVANFSIATSESWKDKSTGEKKEKTEWHNIVVFGGLAEIVEKYVHKGSKVYVEGSLQTRKWEKDGVDRYSTEIVLKPFNGNLILCGAPGGSGQDQGGGNNQGGQAQNRQQSSQQTGGRGGFSADLDDEIPF